MALCGCSGSSTGSGSGSGGATATGATAGSGGQTFAGTTAPGTTGDGTTAGTATGGTDTTGGATGGTTGTATGETTGGTTGGPDCNPPCNSPEVCVSGVCQIPQICQPGTWICAGLTGKKQCSADGTAFLEAEVCPGDQLCSAGECGLKCNLDPKWGAYVGCVFWTVDLPVWSDPTLPQSGVLPHAVVVSNPSEMAATVNFVAPPGVNFNFANLEVPGLGSRVFEFPSMDVSENGSDITERGIRLESNRPVLVHQFNPWDNTFSNDASLLLPEPLLGQEYIVHSWPTDTRCLLEFDIPNLPFPLDEIGGPCAHSFISVVAPFDDTQVTLRTSARISATVAPEGMEAGFVPTVPVTPAGGILAVTLNKGEVLSVDAMPEAFAGIADLTGSLVLSNKPVAVFSGHDSAAVSDPAASPPNDDGCCLDHLEEQMIPTSLLGTNYVATKSASRGGETDLWRVVAAEDGVTLTTVPAINGLHGKTLAKRGDWVEGYTDQSFEIQATGRVQVGQYLVAQGNTKDVTGDPSLILAIPSDRWRATYPIMVPPDYSKNYVTVVRSAGVVISVDGTPVDETLFQPIASGAWEMAWVELTNGFHTVTGTEAFGLSAYGYNNAVSYGYPGGMTIPGEANP